MKINMHAGHNPDGKVACGATGFLKESTEARNVKNAAIIKGSRTHSVRLYGEQWNIAGRHPEENRCKV